MYYESGYQLVKVCEPDEVMRPVRLLHLGISGALFFMGKSRAVDEAAFFIETQLERCASSAEEFALHFACEGLFGVKIVRFAGELLSA